MNQFKKAKEKSIQSGNKIEKVSDLRKAGVEEKEELQKREDNVVLIENITNKPIESKEEPNQHEITNVIEETPDTLSAIPEKEDIFSTIDEEKNTELDKKELEQQTAIYTQPEVNSIDLTPIVKVITPAPTVTNTQTVFSTENSNTEKPEIIQTIKTTIEPTPKKKIPNIFAPKEEAKSTRKSLVLKPTSVKKAEAYCSKNGGSFNELIQTLLDNFIDEYGI